MKYRIAGWRLWAFWFAVGLGDLRFHDEADDLCPTR
jgi:hypothetical protein